MDDKITFEKAGGKAIHHIPEREAVDFGEVGGSKVGTVSDLLKDLHGERGGMRIAPKSAVTKEDPEIVTDGTKVTEVEFAGRNEAAQISQ